MKHSKFKLFAACLALSFAGGAAAQNSDVIMNEIKPPSAEAKCDLLLMEKLQGINALSRREVALEKVSKADQIILGKGVDKALEIKRSKGVDALQGEIEQCIKTHGWSKYCAAMDVTGSYLHGWEKTEVQKKPESNFFAMGKGLQKKRAATYRKYMPNTFIRAGIASAEHVGYLEYLPEICLEKKK